MQSEVLSVLSELLEEVYGKKEDEQTQDVNGETTGDDRGRHAGTGTYSHQPEYHTYILVVT